MNYLVFDIFTDYLIEQKFYDDISCLRLVCLKYKNIINSNKLFIRNKHAIILNNTLNKIGLDYYTCCELLGSKPEYKYLLNCIYNMASTNDIAYEKYKLNCYQNGTFLKIN